MRIKYIVPFPFKDDAIALRASQIPVQALKESTEVVCEPVVASFDAHAPAAGGSYYEAELLQFFVIQCGLASEDEGYAAVVMDTVSDSGLYELRSRLTIPVIGPGQAAFAFALLLGKRFSILTYGAYHRFLYEKLLDMYHLGSRCVSIRATGVIPDFEALFADDGEEERALLSTAERAIADDGADVIVLGSTTMHQAGTFLTERLDVPVLNPGPLALKLAEDVVDMGLSHSKRAFPSPGRLQDGTYAIVGAPGDLPS